MTAPESHPMTPEKLAEIRGHIERRAPRCCDIGRAYPGTHREGCPEQVAEDALALLAAVERLTADLAAVEEKRRVATVIANRMTRERDEANARAEAAVAILRRLEWIPDDMGKPTEICHVCVSKVERGHAPDCELAALLAALGGDDGE